MAKCTWRSATRRVAVCPHRWHPPDLTVMQMIYAGISTEGAAHMGHCPALIHRKTLVPTGKVIDSCDNHPHAPPRVGERVSVSGKTSHFFVDECGELMFTKWTVGKVLPPPPPPGKMGQMGL